MDFQIGTANKIPLASVNMNLPGLLGFVAVFLEFY
jgi:hypothetical protein